MSMFSSTLISIGYPIAEKVTNIEDLKSELNHINYDILFIDNLIEGSDYCHILEEVRALKPRLFISIMCEKPTEADIKKIGKLGGNAILLKPFSKALVKKIIDKCIGLNPKKIKSQASKVEYESPQKKRIRNLLTKLSNAKTVLSVELDKAESTDDSESTQFTCLVKEVFQESITFTTIVPENLAEVVPGKGIRVMIKHDIGSIEFYSTITQIKTKEGKLVYSVTFPKGIVYVERRQTKRYTIEDKQILAAFKLNRDEIKDALVSDISSKNICVKIRGRDFTANLRVGLLIKDLSFTCAGEEHVIPKFRLARFLFDADKNVSILAGYFDGMDAERERKLSASLEKLLGNNQRASAG